MASLLDTYPIRILVNGQDVTGQADDGTTFSNVDPGGFEACTLVLPRDCPEFQVGMPIRIECGTQTVWEGLISQVDRALGPKTSITGAGYGQYLKDNMVSFVWVDRDLTRWTQPSVGRQIALVNSNLQLQSFQVGADPKAQLAPSIVETISNSWTSPWAPTVEAWYDSGPENTINQIYWNLSLDSTVGGTFNDVVAISTDDLYTTHDQTTATVGSSPAYFTPADAYRFGVLRHIYGSSSGGGSQGTTYNAYWKNTAMYGPSGLTGRGSDPVGFYPSDIVQHVLTTLPSGLVVPGVIPDYTSYIVPHYPQYVPVPVEQVISDMAGLAGVHWGTWESLAPLTGAQTPRVDFRPYPSTATAFCLREDCDDLDIQENLSSYYSNAQVTFTDVTGVQQAVLVTLDNPFLDAVGYQRTLQIDAGTATRSIAQTFGTLVLALSQLQARATGSVTFSQPIKTLGGTAPAFFLRSGIDRLRVIDLPTTASAFGQTTSDFNISRVETTVSSDGFSTNVELGLGADLLEVTQSRLETASVLADVL